MSEVWEAEGPVLVLAAPGTGKTHSLGRRVKYLVEECQVSPDAIMVITFTAAATMEMRLRISDPDPEKKDLYLAPDQRPHISTMHSLGNSVILEKAPSLGLTPPLRLYGVRDQDNVLMGDAAQIEGRARADGEETLECRQRGRCSRDDSPKCAVCGRYGRILRACNAVDHHDQILLACELLRADEELLSRYRARARHLLVDEYQDINAGQFDLIRLLSSGNPQGLFVVGDDDQSIYSWRGGSPEYIRGFRSDFGEQAHVRTLSHSRRCHPNILKAAIAVVASHDSCRRDKGEFTYEHPDGEKIKIHDAPSAKGEAGVARAIIREALPSKDVLVLVPTRQHAKMLTGLLRHARIPYSASAPPPGTGLDVIERLGTWLGDTADSLALRDCIQAMMDSGSLDVPGPAAKTTANKDAREAALLKVAGLWEHVVRKKKASLFDSLRLGAASEPLLAAILSKLDDLSALEALPALPKNQKAIADFMRLVAVCLKPWAWPRAMLREVDAWVDSAAKDRGGGPAQVRVMTMVGAKGLEADVVIVLGLEQGVMPKEGAEGEELAEQARLMYVSMTRAKGELHLFHCRQRSGEVSHQSIDRERGSKMPQRSTFLEAIPHQLVEPCYHQSEAKKQRAKSRASKQPGRSPTKDA